PPLRARRRSRRAHPRGLAHRSRVARQAGTPLRPCADGARKPHRCRPGRQPAAGGGSWWAPGRAADAPRGVVCRPAAAGGGATPTPAPASADRILVADDELGPRDSLRMLLKPAYQITTAESGRVALDLLSRVRPDVVILDIKMPEMDGLEVLRRVKR